MAKRVAVVGAGAVGVTAAGDLAARGADVTLFDRGSVAAESSGRAAGIAYDAYAEDVDAALADRALERFRALDGNGSFELTPCPYVIAVREGDDDAAAIDAMVDRMRSHDRDVSVVDPDALGDRFPLRTDDLAVAAVAADAAWTDPAAYTETMADRAVREGVDLRTNTEVTLAPDAPGVVVDGEQRRFDAVLVAVGAHTKRLLGEAGIPIALKPYRVQALTGTEPYAGPITYDATEGVYFRPHPDGLLAGDGTEPVEADPDAWDRSGDDWFVANVADVLRERADYDIGAVDPTSDDETNQGDANSLGRSWAGLCTATPDGNPLLGELRDDIYVAAGWQGHGFMLAPATAEAVAEEILGGEGISPFDPRRFDGTEEFDVTEGMSVENR